MSTTRHRIGVLGLSLLASLGLMALVVANAQGNWLVEGAEITSNQPVVPKRHTIWGLSVESLGLEISCSKTGSSNLTLLAKSATAEGDIEMSECTTKQKGVLVPKCAPINQPIKLGLKILLILHNSNVYLLLEPRAASGKITTFEFSEECAITTTTELTGTSVDECGHLTEPGSTWVFLSCANGEARHYIRPASRLLFLSDFLRFGKREAFETGITELELSGANKGKKWSGTI